MRARRGAAQQGHPLRRRRHVSGGVWGLQVGYCMMVGGPDESVKRLTPFLDVLAPPTDRGARPGLGPHGPGRRGPLREDGPQRHRVRDHAGLRRGLRPLRQVRVRRSTTRRSPTSGCRARSSARGCASSPPAPSSRRATTSRTLEPYVEDSGEGRWTIEDAHRQARSPTPVITARSVRALLLARPDGDYAAQGQRRAAQPVRRPRGEARRADGDRHDAPARTNPLVEGLERLPVHPTTLVDLRRDRRPRAAQAAAGALQPRPRGRAARALQPHRRRRARA